MANTSYVPDLNGVAVISTATNNVTANVNVDGPNGIAITPNGKYAYVTSIPSYKWSQEIRLKVISTATNKVTAT